MKYPFKIRADDIELERLLRRLAKDRTVTINGDKSVIKRLNQKIKPIRGDIFIGLDRSTLDSNISIKNPFLKCEKDKKNYIFKF